MITGSATEGWIMRMKLRTAFLITAGLLLLGATGETGRLSPANSETRPLLDTAPFPTLPILIDHTGAAPELERPAVSFNHDQHTRALIQRKIEDCGVCHALKESDKRLSNQEVAVFKFPKSAYDETDKTSIMYAYHEACVRKPDLI
jgi:hypothetical protein